MLNIGYKNHPKYLGIFVLKLYLYNETFEDIFKHSALRSVYKKYVTRLWIKREQFRCGDTAEIDK